MSVNVEPPRKRKRSVEGPTGPTIRPVRTSKKTRYATEDSEKDSPEATCASSVGDGVEASSRSQATFMVRQGGSVEDPIIDLHKMKPASIRSERTMRIATACDTCRIRKVKCVSNGHDSVCSRCQKCGVPCVYQPPRAGGPRTRVSMPAEIVAERDETASPSAESFPGTLLPVDMLTSAKVHDNSLSFKTLPARTFPEPSSPDREAQTPPNASNPLYFDPQHYSQPLQSDNSHEPLYDIHRPQPTSHNHYSHPQGWPIEPRPTPVYSKWPSSMLPFFSVPSFNLPQRTSFPESTISTNTASSFVPPTWNAPVPNLSAMYIPNEVYPSRETHAEHGGSFGAEVLESYHPSLLSTPLSTSLDWSSNVNHTVVGRSGDGSESPSSSNGGEFFRPTSREDSSRYMW